MRKKNIVNIQINIFSIGYNIMTMHIEIEKKIGI
jgi:hypothetical protein